MAATSDDLFAFLAGLDIAVTTTAHPPLFTVAESQALRGLIPGGHTKNLFVKDRKGRLFLVVALEDAVIDLKALPAAVGTGRRSWLPSKGQVGFGIDFAVRVAPPADAEEASGEVGEFFWDGAANTLFWVDPANQLAAVLFAQWLPFGKVPLHKAFRDAVYADDSSAAAPRP